MRMTQLLIRSLMLLLAAWKSLATDGESNLQSGTMVEAIEPSESAQKIGGGASMPPSGNFESEYDFSETEIDVESREGVCLCEDQSEVIFSQMENMELLDSTVEESSLSHMERIHAVLLTASANMKLVKNLNAEVAQVKEDLAKAYSERDGFKVDVAALRIDISKLKQDQELKERHMEDAAKDMREEIANLKESLKECILLERQMALLKQDLEHSTQREVESNKNLKMLEGVQEEKKRLDNLLSVKIEQIEQQTESQRACNDKLVSIQSELNHVIENYNDDKKSLKKKQKDLQSSIRNLKEQLAHHEDHARNHYCNATAMRMDFEDRLFELKTTLTEFFGPPLENLHQSASTIFSSFKTATLSLYKQHCHPHVRKYVAPHYKLYLEPHLTKLTKIINEALTSVHLLLVDTVRGLSKYVLYKIDQREHPQWTQESNRMKHWPKHLQDRERDNMPPLPRKYPQLIKDALAYIEANPAQFVSAWFKATVFILFTFILWNLILTFVLGPIMLVLGLILYVGIEIPFNFVYFIGSKLKRITRCLLRRSTPSSLYIPSTSPTSTPSKSDKNGAKNRTKKPAVVQI